MLLSQNFRSRRQVLSAANFVFGSIMSRQMGEMDYGPEEQLNYGATGYPERSDTDTEFHLISVADSEEERFDRTEVEARFVAHRIRQLLDEGFPVQGEDGQQRPVRPEDIVILMRSPAARRKAFTAALQREDIPCAGGEEQSFFETMEIAVMVSFLQIVDNPRQDVPLLAVLRSPLLGFSPDRLAQIRGGHPGGDYYGALCADDGEDSRAFLERLAQLRAAAGELTADRLLWKLYTDWQALAVFGAMEGGAQRRSNLLALYAYAGQLAAAGRGNLFDFVSYLHDLMESGDLPDISARQESGGVQLMTIHKSKGLEFPVVILADLQKGFNRDDFQRPVLVHPRLGLGTERVDRQRRIRYDTVSKQAIQLALSRESLAEEMRILYVAMTRAKEKLIITSVQNQLDKTLSAYAGALTEQGKISPYVARSASCYADWMLMALNFHPDFTRICMDLGCMPEDTITFPLCRFVPVLAKVSQLPQQNQGEQLEMTCAPDEQLVAQIAQLCTETYPDPDARSIVTKLSVSQVVHPDSEQTPFSKEPAFFTAESGEQDALLTGAQLGTAMHTFMSCADHAHASRDLEGEIQRLVSEQFITPRQGRSLDRSQILRYYDSALYRRICASPCVRREFAFQSQLGTKFL